MVLILLFPAQPAQVFGAAALVVRRREIFARGGRGLFLYGGCGFLVGFFRLAARRGQIKFDNRPFKQEIIHHAVHNADGD